MVTAWADVAKSPFTRKHNEFVSVDARYDIKNDPRSYEMLSKDSSAVVTPLDTVRSPQSGRKTPDYFGQTARYHAPTRSYSSPRPPPQVSSWDPKETFASANGYEGTSPSSPKGFADMNPLGMNRV